MSTLFQSVIKTLDNDADLRKKVLKHYADLYLQRAAHRPVTTRRKSQRYAKQSIDVRRMMIAAGHPVDQIVDAVIASENAQGRPRRPRSTVAASVQTEMYHYKKHGEFQSFPSEKAKSWR